MGRIDGAYCWREKAGVKWRWRGILKTVGPVLARESCGLTTEGRWRVKAWWVKGNAKEWTKSGKDRWGEQWAVLQGLASHPPHPSCNRDVTWQRDRNSHSRSVCWARHGVDCDPIS